MPTATRQDFAAARKQATAAADELFALARAAYPDDMADFRRLLADFWRAKEAETEASEREIADLLNSSSPSADKRLRTATKNLKDEVDRQKKEGNRNNQIAQAVSILTGVLLLFTI